MSTALNFRIESLLTNKDGKITGDVSSVSFANQVCRSFDQKYNRVARIYFDDRAIFQRVEDGGYTGHDIFLIANQDAIFLWLSLWVDTGLRGIPVAIANQEDPEIIIPAIYNKEKFARKLSLEEIRQVFKYVFGHPNCIDVKTMQTP